MRALSPYIQIARVDHWFKNIFVLPGFLAALLAGGMVDVTNAFSNLILCLISTCLIASGYYSINEWLDGEFDKLHPTKSSRPAAQGLIAGRYAWLQWAVLSASGLFLASQINGALLITALALVGMGLLYNVPPARTKDIAYVDVLSESLNNPLRFLIGWTAIMGSILPPSSVLLAYWMGGGFLMAVKRFSEYRYIADPDRAGQYRRSFSHYTEETLLASAFFYSLSSSFFLGVFLVKYRVEYLLVMPLFASLFTLYLWIGLRVDSVAQRPEKLYRERAMLFLLLLLAVVFGVTTFVDMPWLNALLEPVRLQ